MQRPSAVPLVLVPALGAVQGGFQPDAWVWAGALAAWAAAVALVASSTPGLLRAQWPWAAAAAAAPRSGLPCRRSGRARRRSRCSRRAARSSTRPSCSRSCSSRDAARRALLVLATTSRSRAGSSCTRSRRYLLSARHYDTFEAYYAQPAARLRERGRDSRGARDPARDRHRRAESTAAIGLVAAATVRCCCSRSTSRRATRHGWRSASASRLIALLHAEPRRFARRARRSRRSVHRSDRAAARDQPHHGGRRDAADRRDGALHCRCSPAPLLPRKPRRMRRIRITAPRSLRRRATLAVIAVLALSGAAAVVAHAGASEPRSVVLPASRGTTSRRASAARLRRRHVRILWARSGKPAQFGGALDAHSLYLETLAELGPIGLAPRAAASTRTATCVTCIAHTPYVPAAPARYVAFLFTPVSTGTGSSLQSSSPRSAAPRRCRRGLPTGSAPIDQRRRLALRSRSRSCSAPARSPARAATPSRPPRKRRGPRTAGPLADTP